MQQEMDDLKAVIDEKSNELANAVAQIQDVQRLLENEKANWHHQSQMYEARDAELR